MRSPTLIALLLTGTFFLGTLHLCCEEPTMLDRHSRQRNVDTLLHQRLTPATMRDKGFSIACRFTDHTVKEGTLPARPTGLLDVMVLFDAHKGQAIRDIASVALDVREGQKTLLHVPVQTSSYPRPNGVASLRFSIHKDLLPKALLLLQDGREGTWPSFHVDLHSFYKAKDSVEEE